MLRGGEYFRQCSQLIFLRTFSDLGGGKFRLFISKIYLKFRKEITELINI